MRLNHARDLTAMFIATTFTFAAGLLTMADVRYDVIDMGTVPAAFATNPMGLNDSGTIVGMGQFSISPRLRAWKWTQAEGYTMLPLHPLQSNTRATDINNDGLIVGDGGPDGLYAWRFRNDAYWTIEPLPGDDISVAHASNGLGDVAGTSGDFSFFGKTAILALDGRGTQIVLESAEARHVNDARQVVGWTTSNIGYRWSESTGQFVLPPLGSRSLSFAYSINDHGDVVGQAKTVSGDLKVPFIYTDSRGMQEIGDFGDQAVALDINDSRQVVGNWERGGAQHPWIWSAAEGVTLLEDAIDPAENLNLLSVQRINENGQIIGYGIDSISGEDRIVLLTPVGGLSFSLSGACPGTMALDISGATPDGRVGILGALNTGSIVIPPGNPCAGTMLGLDSSARLIAVTTADATGNASVSGNAPARACGHFFLQAIDAAACEASNVEGL